MKKLPNVTQSWADFHKIIMSDVPCAILVTAIQLKVFDAIAKPASAEEIAKKLGSHPRNTELFLNTLAGIDVIQKRNDLFFNTSASADFLVTSSPCYLGAFFLHYREWHDQLKSNLKTLIVNGPPEHQMRESSNGGIWARSARLSAAYQFCGPAQYITQIVSEQPEFPTMKSMLDLGGGAGFFTQAIVGSHPSMKGVIFEQPPVVKVAREFLKEYDANTRISVKEGDYMVDALGNSFDLIFASATLNFYKSRLKELFIKIHDALAPGGLFITHQDGFTGERTKPVCHIMEFLAGELCGDDIALPQGLVSQTMIDVGFQSVHSFMQESDIGDMDINIGRKAK